MKPYIALLLSAIVCASCGRNVHNTTAGEAMNDARYSAGQVWSYQTRNGEEKSRLYIVRIEPNPKLGTIYHIALDNLILKNPHSPEGIQHTLPHSPVSERTLAESVVSLIETKKSDMPDISEGYRAWRDAFDQGKGGVFTIPVSNIVQYIEDIVNGKTDG